MMTVAETRQWEIGRYTVLQRVRPDNPYWPVYIVLKRGRIIGRSFSIPDEDCCRWLEHWGDRYAESSAESPPYGYATTEHRQRAGGARARYASWSKALAKAA